MLTREFQVTFLTPAFLGDAEQNGRWRTPPFKAQLRQWWRVAYAVAHGFPDDITQMREEEGKLFGHAWLENDVVERDGRGEKTAGRKSRVRLRLSRWDVGSLKSWDGLEQDPVFHPETVKTHFKVGPHAYLAYGPLDGRDGTKLNKRNAVLEPGGSATLLLAFPKEEATLLDSALWLMHRYGTVGGRSRNGWGSYELSPSPLGREGGGEGLPLRPWGKCLDLDWPHAIGTDEKGPLIWQTAPHDDWKRLMRTLAIIKIGLRTQFSLTTGKIAPEPEKRHWLSYPVTNHDVAGWGGLRLPNSLRFKVRKGADGRLVGVIFHMPCSPPTTFKPDRNTLEKVWKRVHEFLDALCRPRHQRLHPGLLPEQADQLAQVSLLRTQE